MKTSSSRVIKSQDVKFMKAMEMPATASHGQEGQSQLSGEEYASSNMDRMKEMVTRKVQRASQEAFEKGMSAGITKGRELQKQDTVQTLQAMSQVVQETSALKKNILATIEKQIISLSLAIAEKVIHSEVKTSSDVIKHVLRDAIKSIVDRENMKIRLNPIDFRTMMDIKNDFLQNFDGIKNVVFEEDEAIQRGGAIIESIFGEIDARLEQQYQEIEAVMTSSECRET
jgi:flagellar assembly protein FliH